MLWDTLYDMYFISGKLPEIQIVNDSMIGLLVIQIYSLQRTASSERCFPLPETFVNLILLDLFFTVHTKTPIY